MSFMPQELKFDKNTMNPNSTEVYIRLMILKFVVSHSYITPPKSIFIDLAKNWTELEKENLEKEFEKKMIETVSVIKEYGLWKYVSKTEKYFLLTSGSKMDEDAQINANWRMEAAGVLMWALNIINDFPSLNVQFNIENLKDVEIKKHEIFSNTFKLRAHQEIFKMRDLIEVWHWRINTRRLLENNYDFEPDENMKKAGINSLDDIVRKTAKFAYDKGNIKEIIDEDFVFRRKPIRDLNSDEFSEATSIIKERHYALNWLCGYSPNNDWDSTPTDT